MKKTDSDLPILPPIDFDPPSNGEYAPIGPTEVGRKRWEMWKSIVEEKHRRLGISRRAFAQSACGTAAWLFTINQVGCSSEGPNPGDTGTGGAAGSGGSGMAGAGGSAGGGRGGSAGSGGSSGSGGSAGSGGSGGSGQPNPDAGRYDVRQDMMEDMGAAREALSGNEFIFDVQTHVQPTEVPWNGTRAPNQVLNFMSQIFVESETTVACITGTPDTRNQGPACNRARTQMLELMERYGGSRLLFHCNTDPERAGEPDYMGQAVMDFRGIAAWKGYPLPRTPNGLANDNLLGTYVKAARDLNVKIIAMHRGISGDVYTGPNSPLDVVRAAKAAPDLKFLVYHGGWAGGTEGPYDPQAPSNTLAGVNRFVRALEENGIPPNSNVYAELGTTWRNLAQQPQNAAHALGKLLKYVGEDRVLWGTDCVMGGSPRGQIAAMRMLVIPEALQVMHGYPALTDALRRKIFGLNGAAAYGIDPAKTRYRVSADDIAQLRLAYLHDPRSVPLPEQRYRGPRTRREFLAFLRSEEADGHKHFHG
jgi:uncharacterized protein